MMATVEMSRIRWRVGVALLAGVSVASLSACAADSLETSTPSPSQLMTPPATVGDPSDESLEGSQTSESVDPTVSGDGSVEVVNAENAYDVCLELLEAKSPAPGGVPGGYSRDKLAPESESVIYQRQDGIFGVGIYGTVGDTWNTEQRDYLLTCLIEGPVDDPDWYDLGIRKSRDTGELVTMFEEYDVHAGS